MKTKVSNVEPVFPRLIICRPGYPNSGAVIFQYGYREGIVVHCPVNAVCFLGETFQESFVNYEPFDGVLEMEN